jgi:hypothetical protein
MFMLTTWQSVVIYLDAFVNLISDYCVHMEDIFGQNVWTGYLSIFGSQCNECANLIAEYSVHHEPQYSFEIMHIVA